MADRSTKHTDENNIKVDSSSIRLLAELLDELSLSEIEIGEGSTKIKVARSLPNQQQANLLPSQIDIQNDNAHDLNISHRSEEKASKLMDGAVVSPLVGVVYHAPEPGAETFVKVGDSVKEGDTLFIVEAMKTMNPIRSPRDGQVNQIKVKNGTPVEYGEVLLILE